jgi:hypothetical protein
MSVSNKARVLLLIVAWCTIFPSNAFAYLDPGTGSLIFQTVIAALAAVGFGMRHYWGRIRMWVKRPRGGSDPSNQPPAGPV